jgi:hypothetical protein
MTPLEIGQFNVTCQNLAGATVPCDNSNGWTADAALDGTFLSSDISQAQIYSQATPPVSGLVTYTTTNLDTCSGTLNVAGSIPGNTTYSCAFAPSSVNLTTNDTQAFALSCYDNGTILTPPTQVPTYGLIAGLTGNLDPNSETVNGVTYDAPATSTTGDLQGVAYSPVAPSVIGAVALATVNVSANNTLQNTTPTNATPYNCTISPASMTLGDQEAGIFNVTCLNNDSTSVACTGGTWAWSPDDFGDFFAAGTTDTQAEAYPLVSSGTGLLSYASGLASCNSSVTAVPANYTCTFTPSSWSTQNLSDTNYFAAAVDDLTSGTAVPVTVPTFAYGLADGLSGGVSNTSSSGAQYTAPGVSTSGELQGAFTVDPADNPPQIIPICLASITVGTPSPPCVGANCPTPPPCASVSCPPAGPPNGQSQYCTISGNSFLYPGDNESFYLMCNNPYEPCTTATWTLVNATPLSVTNNNVSVEIGVTEDSGSITATVNGAASHTCTMAFSSIATTCADKS